MTTSAQEALASLPNLDQLLLSGSSLRDNIGQALLDATVTRTINGAPTLALNIDDPQRTVLKSGIFANRVSAHISPFTYEVAQVSKSGSSLTVTCEDQVVAELRRHNGPLAVGAQLVTHVAFAKRLVKEVGWIKFVTDPAIHVPLSKEPLMRGDPTQPKRSSGRYESTWDAINRIAQARGWRVFVRGVDELWYVPDSYLLSSKTFYPLSEDNEEVDNIDFDFDEGKPVANLKVTVRSSLWSLPPGSLAVVSDLPPVNGKWIVQDVSKPIGSTTTDVTFTKSQPILPEPAQAAVVAGGAPALASTYQTGGALIPISAPPPELLRAMPGAQSSTVSAGVGGVAPARTNSRLAADFVMEALSQAGKAYVYGAATSASNPSPASFDCSLLVQWAAARVGVSIPRTSGQQYALARQHGTLIPVENAKHIRGTILFLGVAGSEHVVISLGNGKDTIEARGRAYGVNEFSINRDNWSGAAYIPGMRY